MQNKTCKQCSTDFVIEDEDLEFYVKVGPEFGGKKFPIPVPEICPECREQKRMAWRNENKLYKRKCYLCSEEMVSVYSPDKDVKVCCQKCFWSDKWDAVDVGRSFDFERPFFEQFDELLKETKLISLFGSNNENSEYVNQETDDNNCYLCFGGHFNENCYYCTFSLEGRKNIDNYWVWKNENLYECVYVMDSYNCFYSTFLQNCRDCYFCFDCTGCSDCFGCTNLERKRYYFFNREYTKEEYQKEIKKYLDSYEGIERAKKESQEHFLKYPRRFARLRNCENSTGDALRGCKNVKSAFFFEDTEDSKFGSIGGFLKDSYDFYAVGWGERCYECASSIKIPGSFVVTHNVESSNCMYCAVVFNNNDLFGCAGLVKKQYCILNKQYTREEYEELLPKIIEHMQKTGEWGQFFPIKYSFYGYNETIAQEYYPLIRDEAIKYGYKWQDNDFGIKYDGPFYEPKDISEYDPKISPNAQKEIEECKTGILKCEVLGKPYKILPQELAQYIERNIQIPRKHPDQRHLERLTRLNPMKLWHRQCMCEESGHDHDGNRCSVEFETTYAPERPEIVYCENCYQKSVM
ncbi:hypothetical protein KJ855_04110 [Patescibacteria group bacterium]|nr:hypothetical protein [Patescibacteria group bacterium]